MKNISIGRLVLIIGILILSLGLLCNSFGLLTTSAFRAVVLVGIIAEAAALFLILKRREF